MGRAGAVKKDRLEIIGGIATAIEIMGLLRPGESVGEALLRYGEDDSVAEEEVREYLNNRLIEVIKEKAA